MGHQKGYIGLAILSFVFLIVVLSLLSSYSHKFKSKVVSTVAATASAQPNIIVINTDDQDYAALSKMPKVNQYLVNAGTKFTNNLVTNSLCCPSRATFLTGQFTHNHDVWHVIPPTGGYGVFKSNGLDQNNLAIWLRNAGYTTAHIGKYLNGYGIDNPATEVPTGWTEWYGSVDNSTYQYYNYTLNENGNLVTYGSTEADYQTDVYKAKAVDFIQRHATDSAGFFMWFNTTAPHADNPNDPNDMSGPTPANRHIGLFANEPLPQNPNFNEADVSDKPNYIKNLPLLTQTDINDVTRHYRARLETLQAVDDAVEAIYNQLQATGKLDNTYIVFTSDNGYFHGEHRFKNSKVWVHEESIKVPLVIKGPNVPTQTVDKIVGNVDLTPTILEWSGATAGLTQDGKSLNPLIQNPSLTSWRNFFLIEGVDQSYFAVRGGTYVYSERSSGEKEWYNIITDPYQLTAANSLVPIFHETLIDMKACAGVNCDTGTNLFFDDFQTGNFGTKWTESNEFDWLVGGFVESNIPEYTSTNKVARANACTSAGGCVLTQTTAVNLTTYSSPKLKFWRYVDNDLDAGEFLKVEVYNGTSWVQIFNWTNGSGDDDIWHREVVDLNPYKNSAFKVRFTSKESSSLEDTQVDNVAIDGIAP